LSQHLDDRQIEVRRPQQIEPSLVDCSRKEKIRDPNRLAGTVDGLQMTSQGRRKIYPARWLVSAKETRQVQQTLTPTKERRGVILRPAVERVDFDRIVARQR